MSVPLSGFGCERCRRPVETEEQIVCENCDRWSRCTNGSSCVAINKHCYVDEENGQYLSYETINGEVWHSRGEGQCGPCSEDEWFRAYTNPDFPKDRGREMFKTSRGYSSRDMFKIRVAWRKFFLNLPDGWVLTSIDKPWDEHPDFKVQYRPDAFDSFMPATAQVSFLGWDATFGEGDGQLFNSAKVAAAGHGKNFNADMARALLAVFRDDAEKDAESSLSWARLLEAIKQSRRAEPEVKF